MNFTSAELETCLRVLQEVSTDPTMMDHHDRFKALVAKVHHLGKKAKKKRLRQALRQEQLARAVQTDTDPQFDPGTAVSAQGDASTVRYQGLRHCYVCKTLFNENHAIYDQLCPACAEFNTRKRNQRVDLSGRIALLTVGRVKIGFEIARKLLQDGARVHLTTRFPLDALARLSALPEWDKWESRLTVHALDLRDLRAVDALAEELLAGESHLDIVIHNAAQTIKRPLAFYQHLLEAEAAAPAHLRNRMSRGAASVLLEARPEYSAHLLGVESYFPQGQMDGFGEQIDLRPMNSWRQKLGEVGTPEFLEAFLVGAAAPFHLTTRLLPAMRRSPNARRFVVSVSAREGQFAWRNKTPHHPHTNMTKAALNMLTRTASKDLACEGIYLTCVDTGWITHELPYPEAQRCREEYGFHVPLDLIDGAARVYDPIVRGLTEPGEPLHGHFLKDYSIAPW